MNAEGSLFDVPPAAYGRFRVLRPLGAGATGPVFLGEDPDTLETVVIKAFGTDLAPDRAHALSQALQSLVTLTPTHEAIALPVAAGVDEIEPYWVTRLAPGDSLDVALRNVGPAAIGDVVPRLRLLADALDLAAQTGLVHGALSPNAIVVSPTTTVMTGLGVTPLLTRIGVAGQAKRPYAAPEVLAGGHASPAADQFALAAITYQWLCGREATGPADTVVTVPALPGVDDEALSGALSTALAPEPHYRFDSCMAFCNAVSASVIEAVSPQRAARRSTRRPDAGVVPKLPLVDTDLDAAVSPSPVVEIESARAVDPTPLIDRHPSLSSRKQAERWSNGALVASLVIGLIFGFAAGYMAIPRALMQQEPRGQIGPPTALGAAGVGSVEAAPAAPAAPVAREAPAVPIALAVGRLLIRSTPSGASVDVDGLPRGVTPLAVRDLDLGTRTVVLTRRGYAAVERRVDLTKSRPSRSLEVRLSAETAMSNRAGGARSGSMVVESRPPGATVTVDGRSSGVTPLTLEEMAPGPHAVSFTLEGYRPFTTTVRVVAGERARAAASLIGAQEKE